MDRRIAPMLVAATLAGCGAAGEADAAPATPAQQAAWLTPHNQVRAGTFPGVTVSPAPSPALPALTWSASAAAVAQAWANGCTWGHNPVRNPDGVARGENIAASTGNLTESATVAMWAGEWSWYAHATNTCSAPPNNSCGHYTQLVWRSTLRVGCATARCTTGSPFTGSSTWTYVVCDYEPPGNVRGQKPY